MGQLPFRGRESRQTEQGGGEGAYIVGSQDALTLNQLMRFLDKHIKELESLLVDGMLSGDDAMVASAYRTYTASLLTYRQIREEIVRLVRLNNLDFQKEQD